MKPKLHWQILVVMVIGAVTGAVFQSVYKGFL